MAITFSPAEAEGNIITSFVAVRVLSGHSPSPTAHRTAAFLKFDEDESSIGLA